MSYVLFISEAKLKDSTAINLNVSSDLLLPYVRQAQKLYIETKLGTDINNGLNIKGGVENSSMGKDIEKLEPELKLQTVLLGQIVD